MTMRSKSACLFGGVPERVVVPFDAITAFFDPAVQFGLQFETIEGQAADDTGPIKDQDLQPSAASKAETSPAPEPEPVPDHEPGGAEVVRLDRFRKK